MKYSICVLLLLFIIATPSPAADIVVHECIERALNRLYSFDFPGAHRILDDHIEENPADPLGYGFRASAYLFHELDRLMILESEFFADDKKIAGDKKLTPDPEIRIKLHEALQQTEQLAEARLATKPDDLDALFALCLKEGILADYKGLVEKKQIRSLSNAKKSNKHAVRLLELEPTFYDAYLTTGVSEYLLGSLPFFIRWFVRMDQIKGSKKQAISNLELVAERGRYLGPFAKILLSIICLREKMPERSVVLLQELTDEYPENPLMKKELAKVTMKLERGELPTGGNW
jgi:hypothetical protein